LQAFDWMLGMLQSSADLDGITFPQDHFNQNDMVGPHSFYFSDSPSQFMFCSWASGNGKSTQAFTSLCQIACLSSPTCRISLKLLLLITAAQSTMMKSNKSMERRMGGNSRRQ